MGTFQYICYDAGSSKTQSEDPGWSSNNVSCEVLHTYLVNRVPRWLSDKESSANLGNTRDMGLIPG